MVYILRRKRNATLGKTAVFLKVQIRANLCIHSKNNNLRIKSVNFINENLHSKAAANFQQPAKMKNTNPLLELMQKINNIN